MIMFASPERPKVLKEAEEHLIVVELAEVKNKLKNLARYSPRLNQDVYLFAAYLATYAHTGWLTLDFDRQAELALKDLEDGFHGYTDERIKGKLARKTPEFYEKLRERLPEIKEAIFGEEK